MAKRSSRRIRFARILTGQTKTLTVDTEALGEQYALGGDGTKEALEKMFGKVECRCAAYRFTYGEVDRLRPWERLNYPDMLDITEQEWEDSIASAE